MIALVETNADLEFRQSKGSHIVGKVLSPAIQFWLRSQVESVAELKFQIHGSDRQILRGVIPSVAVTAKQAVYQGLHLSYLHLTANHIQINLGQVLKGKPLRLLEVIPVTGEVVLSQADLTASVHAPLLQQAFLEILKTIAQQAEVEAAILTALQTKPIELHHPTVLLQQHRLSFSAEVTTPTHPLWIVTLQAALNLLSPSQLQLSELVLGYALPGQAETCLPLPPLKLDLGPEVNLQNLLIEPERISCQGQINVIPAPGNI
jgi:LmeA-like phospholipid-binding